ncbi:hypothetical protein DUNSADRAFT_2934 [Dunaliella salina]|nr:hypothetical protein DUNSADRAFT_2934 [Dunaliella salina]|eukprot:KAF5838393.1 hypothetical protein DUNSADRAFT_2934 [Dunaliella salina]
MPLSLQQQGNATIATLRTVCKSWKNACDAAPYEKVKAKLWGTGDKASLAAFLRCHARIQALELSSDPDVSTILAQSKSIDELRGLLLSLPRSLTSVAVEGALAVPLSLVVCALHLPTQLTHLSLQQPPDKWSFVPSMFPWEKSLMEEIVNKKHSGDSKSNGFADLHDVVNILRWGGLPGLQGGPELNRAMYGPAVWERFKEAWLQFEQGVAACLWTMPHLESLVLETPARSLCPGIIRGLTAPDNTVLRSLHLVSVFQRISVDG